MWTVKHLTLSFSMHRLSSNSKQATGYHGNCYFCPAVMEAPP